MKRKEVRKAIFAVAYTISDNGIEYVVLKRKKHWKGWEFPKGKIEKFESKRRTARREVSEETGLKVLDIKKFSVGGLYKYDHEVKDRPGIRGQTYHLFAVEVEKPLDGKIRVDTKEHYKGEWLSFTKASKILTWPNQRKCLRIVHNWIRESHKNRGSFLRRIFS